MKYTFSERATAFILIAAGLSVAVIGLLDLLGWALDLPVLTLWKAGAKPMSPATAVLFVVFGTALCLGVRLPQGRLPLLLITLFAVVGFITALMLLGLRLLGVYLPAELLGLHITGTFGNAPQGHLSPITAFCFLLSYGSLLASLPYGALRSWRGGLLIGLGGLVSLVGFALLLAYAFGLPLLSGTTIVLPALNTSLNLLIVGLAQLVLAARYIGLPAASSDTDSVRRLPYVLTFLVLVAVTFAAAYYLYRESELRFRQEVESQLLTVSDLKTDDLVHWRLERFWDGNLFQNTATAAAVRYLLESPDSVSEQREMKDLLGKYLNTFRYDEAFLIDAKGVTRMSVPDKTEPMAAILVERAAASLRTGQIILQDFYRDEHSQRVYLALIVPIIEKQGSNRPLGVVVLRIDPAIYLYTRLQRWPVPSATAETLLVRREGNEVLYLNDLRFKANTALALRIPLVSNTKLAAVKAVLGQRGIVDGVDYRGMPVIAAVRAVPNSPWYIETHIETAEVYAPLRERMWLTILLISVLVCGAGVLLLIHLWRQQTIVFSLRQFQLTSKLGEREEWYQSILSTVMDGFWLIDMRGRLLEVNDIYCRMSGYSEQELLSMDIADLESLESAEDIIAHIQNITSQSKDRFETRHRRKDGSDFDVEVSVQYKSLEDGRLMVFLRDISERKQAEEEQRISTLKYQALFESSRDALMLLTPPSWKFTAANTATLQLFDASIEAEFIALEPWKLSPERQPDGRLSSEKALEMITTAMREGSHFFEWEHQRLDGQTFPADVLLTRVETGEKTFLQATVRDLTQRKLAEQELRISEERLSIITSSAHDAIIMLDEAGNIAFWNNAAERMFGYTPEEVIGRYLHTILAPLHFREAHFRAFPHFQETGQGAAVGKTIELAGLHKDGREFPLELSLSAVLVKGVWQSIGILRDATERKQAEEKLHLAASVFTNTREGIMITTANGTIIDVNNAFCDITGYSLDETLGRNPSFLSSGRHDTEFFTDLWRDLTEQGNWHGEIWNRRKNGEVYAIMQTISAVRDGQGNIRQYVGIFTDITHEQKLVYSAHYDALTSLPNRVLLADRLHQAMVQSRRSGQLLAVVFLDLDGFKVVNDNYGHEVGDQLLIALSNHMRETLRKGDTLARLGGDEFVAVLIDISDSKALAPFTHLLAAAAKPVQVGKISLQVTASLGVTFYPQREDIDADQLLRQADQAMYQAKQAGKNRYHLFDAEQDSLVRSRYESLECIRRAMNEDEFVLLYQPKVNMRTGTLIGVEALIRWQHPEQGLLLPDQFLLEIGDHPLSIELGEWVIKTVLLQVESWRADGLNIPVSVNVGARQLQQADFVDRLLAMLAAHPNVRPGDLELEVLETCAMEDLTKVSQVIVACRKLGVSFALDDFGTGYSTLTYLKRLPVTQLKIDQSFVSNMINDPDDLAIVKGVIGLANAFGHQVIAEGVETVEHGEILLHLGCDLAQGYSIAYPMPAHELTGWQAVWRPDPSWTEIPSFSHIDLPLLFASADHRAWIAAIEAFLKGERGNPPPLDTHKCHFCRWLNTDGLTRLGAQPNFQVIERLHKQAHEFAAKLCILRNQGSMQEALAMLGELHELRDALLEQMMLAQKSQQNL